MEAFSKIFAERTPKRLQTDKGTEFLNSGVQKYLKKLGINFYTINSEMKACIVERFNRTLKEKMWRYSTLKNNKLYADVLTNIVNSYKNTYHRTIKTKPINVTKKMSLKFGKIHTDMIKNLEMIQ